METTSTGQSATYTGSGLVASGRGRQKGRSVTPQRMPAVSEGDIAQIPDGGALVIHRGTTNWGLIPAGQLGSAPAWQAIARRAA